MGQDGAMGAQGRLDDEIREYQAAVCINPEAGSALPAPLLALAVGDVDGDGRNEVVTLEGDYATGRSGPATHVNVWRWSGFGFTLEYRSPPGTFH